MLTWELFNKCELEFKKLFALPVIPFVLLTPPTTLKRRSIAHFI
jgi:hypothetical protein